MNNLSKDIIVGAICVCLLIAGVVGTAFHAGVMSVPHVDTPTPLHQSNPGLMIASWYGPGFDGKRTASGAIFNPSGHTAASRSIPFGTRLLVGLNGKWVEVVVTDRGPVNKDRDLDLSEGAAKALGFHKHGLAAVHVVKIGDEP